MERQPAPPDQLGRMSAQKTKVAILGGGCGGMAAAFWLTSTPQLRERFDVTVYTRGWRLGGKGASGRDASRANRIEEHGLHMWLGCYENAFRTIRACFDEWQPRPDSALRTWTDAFAPQFQVTFEQLDGGPAGNDWTPWNFVLPRRAGTPGDGKRTWADRVLDLAEWLAGHRGKGMPPPGSPAGTPEASPAAVEAPRPTSMHAGAALTLIAVRGVTLTVVGVRAALGGLAKLLWALRRLPRFARYLILADLGLTMAIGVARDILPFGIAGFDRVNALDLRAWLLRHGAMKGTVNSAPIRAIYDLGFAYPGGDASHFSNGRGAAGAALRFLLEFGLGYKGGPLWKMNAGMGDTVFTPLFQVLQARGVQFRFFHRVARLDLSGDKRSVGAIVVQRQAELLTGSYQPLVDAGGLDCWPDQPRWDQLLDGAALAKAGAAFESVWDTHCTGEQTLRCGVDFDLTVLALPPEMIRIVAPALSEHDASWKRMLDNSTSVATQAFQLWLRPTLTELGWTAGPTVLTAYAAPFDTWADMTHLLPRESWTGADTPQSIAYFCGVMPLPDPLPADPIRAGTLEVERSAAEWMQDNAAEIWPRAMHKGARPEPGVVIADYYRCNLDPSERYVQTLPGSVQYRLAPGCRVYTNLYLAGDWTVTRYSSGCVESAVESGMLAAQAICGEPTTIVGQ